MFAAIRLLASLISLMVGWAASVVALMAVFWYSWSYLANMEMLSELVSQPPAFMSLAVVSFIVPMTLLGAFLVLFTFLPARWVMELFIRKTEHVRLQPDHHLYQETKQLADEIGLSMPALYAYDDKNANAWAFSTLVGSVVCLSLGLVTNLSQDKIRWVIAHELAHIKYFDAGTAAIWASTERVLAIAWRAHSLLVNFILRGASAANLHVLLVAILALPILAVSYTAIAADILSRKLFLLVDRFVGRAMEYRADRLAGKVVGTQTGVGVLEALSNGIEPSLGLFATHPTTPRRIERLQRLGASLEKEAASETGA